MSEIKLEVGQRVRLRNGKIYPVEHADFSFKIDGVLYSLNGKIGRDDYANPYDVVEILPPEPPKAPEPKWEVGVWYKCRDGKHEGKILEMGLPGLYAMAGIRRPIGNHGDWDLSSWSVSGGYHEEDCEDPLDLMPPAPPPEPKRHKVTMWANCYVRGGEVIVDSDYDSKEDADRGAVGDRCDCVPYTVEFTDLFFA